MAHFYELLKNKKFLSGVGVSSAVGIIFYEYLHIKRTLNTLVRTDVLTTKHPDYIYIKYHIYRETMLKKKHEELADKYWINIIVNPIGRWWKVIKHSVAWRLLEVAKTGDYIDRLKAVRQLATIRHLKDWDYQHLAQMCDARTAISLARNACDVRWFLPPKCLGALRVPKSLIYELREHLQKLHPCQCLDNFNKTVFDNFSILKDYEYSSKMSGSPMKVSRQEYEFIRKCLEALFHLTRNTDACRVLIDSGILVTLAEVYKLFHSDLKMSFLLSKILANLSIRRDRGYDFYVTGWIGVLARWTRNPDIRIQVTAAKALVNMDIDDKYPNQYEAKIYPLYPLNRTYQKPQLDIVFVHGLLGGVFITWRQRDPKELDLGLYAGAINKRRGVNQNDYIKTSKQLQAKKSNIFNFWKKERNIQQSITYSDDPLVSTKPETKTETQISDLATKELIETLQTANELKSDWEVVFPDCPTDAGDQSKGPFSVSGHKWINDDQNSEYTFCWPMDWLPQEYPKIRILGLNYETSISEWALNLMCPCDKTKTSLHDRAEEFLHSLAVSKVGDDHPVIWVGHSMGGLVAKSIIVQALESNDPNVRKIGENTRAILFLGTPHKGSPVAHLKRHIQIILSPSIEVKELRENGQLLLQLQEKFEQKMKQIQKPIDIVSIAEGCPTIITTFKFPMKFVNEESAKLDVGDFYVLNVDHLGLSKPVFRQSFLYQRLLKIIDDVIVNMKKEFDSNNNSGEFSDDDIIHNNSSSKYHDIIS